MKFSTFLTLLSRFVLQKRIKFFMAQYLTLLQSIQCRNNCRKSILNKKLFSCSTTFVGGWIGDASAGDQRYISRLDVNWDHITEVIEKLPHRNEYQGIGLLNFNGSEIGQWNELIPDVEHAVLSLDYVSYNTTWESLYPEWIDEEEEFEFPTCPTLPKLQVPGKPRLDLIAVKLPCNKSGDWSRDVARLHLQLTVARLAAASRGYHPVHVLLVTDCFPTPNLFTCKELLVREGNVWLYKPNLNTLLEKLQIPVGSCELAVPFRAEGIF